MISSDDMSRNERPPDPADVELLVTVALRTRRMLNLVNLSTPLGRLVARWGRARCEPGPFGTVLARDFALDWLAPGAPAFTIGDVVLCRADDETLRRRPDLLRHEARHSAQWAWCLGVLGFLPLYLLASAWSWLRVRHVGLRNVFEVQAGLVAGGYLPGPPPGPDQDGPDQDAPDQDRPDQDGPDPQEP